MIFIVIGTKENGPVSVTCASAVAALNRARGLADAGAWDLLIDADGHEYTPADFRRLFIGSRLENAKATSVGLDREHS